jgi:outer membrane receptor protein involved in Fe transport
VGATIAVKGTISGTSSGHDGKYLLTIKQVPPFTLVFSYIGFRTEEITVTEKNTTCDLAMQAESILGKEVVISASRMEENSLKSPVTIEKMDIRVIRQSATPDYFDAIANLKGVQVTNSSLNYTSVNTRGFADVNNTRFVQLVDGMDIAEASILSPLGSVHAPGELDAESVELVPGAASALYGPNAFNGILILESKSPFKYQGLSVMVSPGLTNSNADGAHVMGTYSLRYAQAFRDKLAFKVNLYYMHATDWSSNDYTTDRNNPGSQTDLSKTQNFDGLNLYGDETAIDLTPFGFTTIRRTGIAENTLLDNRNATTFKANAAVHYRINEKTELIGLYQHGRENMISQVDGKYAYRDGNQSFFKLELKGDNFFIRSYINLGRADKSYNLNALGGYVNEAFNPTTTWVPDYLTAFYGGIPGIAAGDSTAARSYADRFMIDPATGKYVPSFQDTIKKIRQTDFQRPTYGASIYVKTSIWTSELYYAFRQIKWADIIAGGNFRQYRMDTQATIFDEAPEDINDQQRILTTTYGAYAQISKTILKKIKLTGSIRFDKMDDFDGHFTPRLSLVYSPAKNHNFRVSYQTGFHYPDMLAQLIYFPQVSGISLGGVPSIASRYGVYNGGAWTPESYNDFIKQGGKLDPATGAILLNPGNVTLQTANIPYLKPEQLWSFEIGYKGVIANSLLVDLNYYYTSYTNFVGTQSVHSKVSTVHQCKQVNAGEAWTLSANSPSTLTSYGIGLGLSNYFPKNFNLSGNYNFTTFHGQQDPGFLTSFNTPRNHFGLGLSNSKLAGNFGFNITWRYQEAFVWESLFGKATMPAYGVLNAQVNYKFTALKTMIKLGGTNLGGYDYRTSFGSPFVGQVYYISFIFDELLK